MNYQRYKKGELITKAISILNERAKLNVDSTNIIDYVQDSVLKEKMRKNINSDVLLDEIEYEEFPRVLLKSVGYIPETTDSIIYIDPILKKYHFNLNDVQINMMADFNKFLCESIQNRKNNNNTIYPHIFLEEMIDKYELRELGFAFEIVDAFVNSAISSPTYSFSKYGNIDPIDLKELFELESNNSNIGDYLDLRYITFLKAHHDKVADIHWRKFEELSAQFYRDNGYEVVMGPGRKDGGRDVYAKKGKEAIIIQCKRLKGNVGTGTIKELHDDVNYYEKENNETTTGVVFCNNDISKDSKKLIADRKYTNIKVFNKEDIINALNKY